MEKKVSVIILNYKTKDLALGCVKSVQSSSYKNLKIYLVDNDSNDAIESKASEFKDLVFIQTGENLGYSGGNNEGIKMALNDGCDYVFVLNPDTKIEKETIRILIKEMDKLGASIASPKIYFEGTKKIWYAGGIFDKSNVLGSHRGVDQQDIGQFEDEIETDFATGAAFMVNRKVFDNIGFFDDRYFLYYEDSDFCFRAREKGFKIMYISKAFVFHFNASATGLGSSLQDYFITRNRLLFASKFLGLRTQFALIREGFRNFGNSSRRLALIDYILGRFGKGSFLI